MEHRSPMELLGAIVDEVEGLRRQDANSHLPEALLREARDVVNETTNTLASNFFTDTSELVGRTVEHVFDGGLIRGDLLIRCSDGGFLVLQVDGCGDDADIGVVYNRYGSKNDIADFLPPYGLFLAGVLTKEQCFQAEKNAQIESAKRVEARALQQLDIARKTLATATS